MPSRVSRIERDSWSERIQQSQLKPIIYIETKAILDGDYSRTNEDIVPDIVARFYLAYVLSV